MYLPRYLCQPCVGLIGNRWFGEHRDHFCCIVVVLFNMWPHTPVLLVFTFRLACVDVLLAEDWELALMSSFPLIRSLSFWETLWSSANASACCANCDGCVCVCVLLLLCCIFHQGGQCVPRHCKLLSGDCLPESPAIQFAAGISFRRKPVSACYAFYHFIPQEVLCSAAVPPLDTQLLHFYSGLPFFPWKTICPTTVYLIM